MESILEQIKKPVVLGAAAVSFVVGLLFGLVVLGWWLMPVEWTDASPSDLQIDYQTDYMRMAVQSYEKNPDAFMAKMRWNALGDTKAQVALLNIKTDPGTISPQAIRAFEEAVQAPAAAVPTSAVAVGQVEEKTGSSPLWVVLLILMGITVVLGAVFGVMFILRQRPSTPRTITPAMEANEALRNAQYTDFSAADTGKPIAQFMASYKIGDDLFDDSFSIDAGSGEFLGECGVGISDTIGVGDPKKVTSFEIWMFDKNDIQTITKVVMSNHAFNDAGIRNRLATKGEAVLAEPGGQTILETATLRLNARIVDLNYGEGALPPLSYFDSLIIELAVWQK